MIVKPVGRVSPTVIADCAGLLPLLVRVKMRLVVAPSLIEAAAKVLATLGLILLTVRHWSVEVLVAPVVVTLAVRLVWAAIGQLPVCPGVLVTPATVTVQVVVPLVMAKPVRPLRTLLPPL